MFAEAPFPVQVVVFLVILAVFSPLIYFVFWLGLESWPGSDLAGRRPGDRDPIWVDPDPAHPRGWHNHRDQNAPPIFPGATVIAHAHPDDAPGHAHSEQHLGPAF
jgi:hypothetical protein